MWARTKRVVISRLAALYGTIKRNQRPQYNHPVTFLSGGFGRRLPIARTRFGDIIPKSLGSGRGVLSACPNILIICLKFAIRLVSLLSGQSSLSKEPNLYSVFVAPSSAYARGTHRTLLWFGKYCIRTTDDKMKHYLQQRKVPDANQWRMLHFDLIIKNTTIYTIKRIFIFLFFSIFTIAIIISNSTKHGRNHALRICA